MKNSILGMFFVFILAVDGGAIPDDVETDIEKELKEHIPDFSRSK